MTQPYGSLYRRGKIWWISYYVDSIQQRESAHTKDRHEAEILLAKRKLQPVEPDARKVASLLDALKSHYVLQGKSPWGPLLIDAHLQPNFGKLHASAIDKTVLTAYVLKRKKQGRSHSTINKEISILRRTFSLAELKFPAFPKLPENAPREGFFTEEEFRAVLEHLPPHLHPIALLGYWTGCRLGELLSLRWKQVDLKARTIRLRASETKSGYGRVIPIASEALSALERLERKGEWVFTYRGKPICGIRAGWTAACRKAGVDRLFHDLRRTAVRNLVRAGVPERVAMEISGHRTRSVFDRYNIVGESELLEAMNRVEKAASKSYLFQAQSLEP